MTMINPPAQEQKLTDLNADTGVNHCSNSNPLPDPSSNEDDALVHSVLRRNKNSNILLGPAAGAEDIDPVMDSAPIIQQLGNNHNGNNNNTFS